MRQRQRKKRLILLAMANMLFDRFQDPGVNEIKDRIKHVFRKRHLFWMGDT